MLKHLSYSFYKQNRRNSGGDPEVSYFLRTNITANAMMMTTPPAVAIINIVSVSSRGVPVGVVELVVVVSVTVRK